MQFLFSGGLGREAQILSKGVSIVIVSWYQTCSVNDVQSPAVSINTLIMPSLGEQENIRP